MEQVLLNRLLQYTSHALGCKVFDVSYHPQHKCTCGLDDLLTQIKKPVKAIPIGK